MNYPDPSRKFFCLMLRQSESLVRVRANARSKSSGSPLLNTGTNN
jgi:hypothetical protein